MQTTSRSCFVHVNGIAMDGADSRFSALAVEDGRIVAVGDREALAPYEQAGWPVVDLDGKTLLPGFIDTHQHLGLTGQMLAGLDFRKARSLETVVRQVAEAASDGAENEWLFGFAMNELLFRERRMPLRVDLDPVCPDRPVMLVHSSYHFMSLNSKALELLNLPPNLPGMDMVDGEPTGVIRDPGAVTHVIPAVSRLTPVSQKLTGFRMACEAALKKGITSLHCLEGGEFGPGDTRVVVDHQQTLPVHTIIWNQVMDIEETVALGLPRIGGCICADGAMSARTAALFEPYCDQPDNYGTLNFEQCAMDEFVLAAHTRGLQVAVHCETERAIEQVLCAMEKAMDAFPREDCRHRIEHCEIPTPDQLSRMGRRGIVAGMQPSFFPYLVDWDDYIDRFGPERMRWIHPYRTMLDEGIVMSGGSDCPITPYAPLEGVQAAVMHPVEEERLTVYEALRMFTIDAAYSGFEERDRGSIEVGKIADLVLLESDPTSVAPASIGDIEVLSVYVAGHLVD